MSAGRYRGRVAALTMSLGIGVAVAVGGIGEAAADTDDPSSSQERSDSGSAGSDADDTSEGAESDDRTGATEPSACDRRTPGGPRTRTTRSDDEPQASAVQPESQPNTDTVSDADADSDIDTDTEPDRRARRSTVTIPTPEPASPPAAPDTTPPPAPAETQLLSVLVASARRQTDQFAEIDTAPAQPNSRPTATVSVEKPDPALGATRVIVLAEDPDDDALTYTASRPAMGRVTDSGAGVFTYTPTTFARLIARAFSFIRTDRFSVTVDDGRGGTTTVKVIAPIVPRNSAPVAGATTVGTPASATGVVVGRVKATDPNRDAIAYTETTKVTDKGTVAITRGGGFTYTPDPVARHRAAAASATTVDKTDTFTVTVTDTFGAVTEIKVAVGIGAANIAPTGTSDVDDPEPQGGVVTGTIVGSDADGDPLTYRGSTATLKGSVVVQSDGSFSYTPSAMARHHAAHPYAVAYDKTDTFGLTLDDGHGGITVVPVSVVISPDTESSALPTLSTFCGCTLMPADTIFHADLRGLAAMPESDTWIDLLGGNRGATLRAAWAGNEWMGSTGGIPVNIVSADHPTEDVVFNRGYSTTGPGIDDRPYAIPDRPLVEGMPSVPAWDRHLLVFQEGTCISQELYNVANGVELPSAGILDALGNAAYAAIWGSTWIAEAGAQYDMSSPLYPAIGHANASRLPYLPMILRPDDLQRGYIDHMLGMSIAKDAGAGYVWPARAGDGSAADGVPMGTVLRLRSDVDISGFAPSTQVVLRALQVHGAVIYDSMAPGSDGAGILAMSNGWAGTDYVTAKRELSTIPINLFEAVDAASLAVNPAAGWQIR